MPLTHEDDLVTVQLEGGDTAAIKSRMSYADIEELTTDDAEALAKGTSFLKLFELNIKEWSFKDRDGEPASVTTENIRRLSLADTATLSEAIMEANPFVLTPSTKGSGPFSRKAKEAKRVPSQENIKTT